MKKIAVLIIVMSLTITLVPQIVYSASESYVIGSITGTHRELPGYYYRHPYLLASGRDEVEFVGFRLINVENGKKYRIRPNHLSYFYQGLPGGEYTLTRKRNDRPNYKEPKIIDIFRFTVEPGTIVNLGTMDIVLDGKPSESLSTLGKKERGTYIYIYSYERERGDEAYEKPLDWFRRKKSKAVAGLGDRIVNVDTGTTSEKDGSKVVIEMN